MSEAPVTEFTLRDRLADLVEGEESLAEFDEWFALSTWDDGDVAVEARRLAAKIELALAELTSGHRSWPETRSDLSRLARSIAGYWGRVPGAATSTTATSSTTITRAGMAECPFGAASIRYEVVCA
jgi:hypothetical protein